MVTLDWPERRNALPVEAMRELAQVLHAEAASDVAAVVLTGNGAFCSGADLRRVAERQAVPEAERRADVRDAAQGMIRTIVDAPVPVIAAVDGPAVGLGFDLALACNDLLIGPDGWCMQGWGRIGAIPATGGLLFLRARNPSLLWKLLAEQPRIGPADAERWGLAEPVAEGTALEAAVARGRALAELPRRALHAYVRLARAPLRAELPGHFDQCADEQVRLLADPGIKDRVATVLDKENRAR